MSNEGAAMGGAGFKSLAAMPWVYKPFTVANPAAGAQFSFTIPANSLYEVVYVGYNLTTNATAGGRGVGVVMTTDLGQELCSVFNNTTIAASSAGAVRFGPGYQNYAVSNIFGVAVPTKLMLTDNYIVKSNVLGLQAGDTITTISLVFRSYTTTTKLSFT